MQKYEDPSNFDPTSQALDKMNVVKSVMRDNLRQAADTSNELQALQHRSEAMEHSAEAFSGSSRELQNAFRWRKIKLAILLCLGVSVPICLLALWLNMG